MKTRDLEREFQIAAMETVYSAVSKECRYDEKVFLKMIVESGARNAAKSLLAARHVQSGLRGLRRQGRLDLSVEHFVIQPRWGDVFTNYERETAREAQGEGKAERPSNQPSMRGGGLSAPQEVLRQGGFSNARYRP